MTPIIQFFNMPRTIPQSPIAAVYADYVSGGENEFCTDMEETFQSMTEAKLLRFLRWIHIRQTGFECYDLESVFKDEDIHPTVRLLVMASLCDTEDHGSGTRWLRNLTSRLLEVRRRPIVSDLIIVPNRGDFIVDTTKIPRAYCHYQLRQDRPRVSDNMRENFRDQCLS